MMLREVFFGESDKLLVELRLDFDLLNRGSGSSRVGSRFLAQRRGERVFAVPLLEVDFCTRESARRRRLRASAAQRQAQGQDACGVAHGRQLVSPRSVSLLVEREECLRYASMPPLPSVRII